MISEKSKANEAWREAISETQTLKTTISKDNFPTFEEFVASMAPGNNSEKEEPKNENIFEENKIESKVIEISGPSKLISLKKSDSKPSKPSKRKSSSKVIEIDHSKHKSLLQGRDSMLTVSGMVSYKNVHK